MEIYRIQSLKKESLWYSFEGKFEDKIKSITGQSIPMPWEDFRQLNDKIKLLSSVKDIKMLSHWFSEEQINKLFNSGYSLYKYDVPEIIELSKGECLFDYNKVINCEEVQSSILDVFYSCNQLCDCKDFTIKGKVFVCKECGKEHKSLSA